MDVGDRIHDAADSRLQDLQLLARNRVIEPAEERVAKILGQRRHRRHRFHRRRQFPHLDIPDSELLQVEREESMRDGTLVGRVEIEVGREDRQAFRVRSFDRNNPIALANVSRPNSDSTTWTASNMITTLTDVRMGKIKVAVAPSAFAARAQIQSTNG